MITTLSLHQTACIRSYVRQAPAPEAWWVDIEATGDAGRVSTITIFARDEEHARELAKGLALGAKP